MTENNNHQPMAVDGAVAELLLSVDDVVRRIPEVLERLEEQRAGIDTQIKQLKAMQKYFAPQEAVSSRKHTNGNSERSEYVSPATLAQFAEGALVVGADGNEFTMLQVLEQVKGSTKPGYRPAAYRAFRELHRRQFLAKTTKDPETRQDLFQVDVEEIIEQIRAEANGVPA
jgi:hypothetical protein